MGPNGVLITTVKFLLLLPFYRTLCGGSFVFSPHYHFHQHLTAFLYSHFLVSLSHGCGLRWLLGLKTIRFFRSSAFMKLFLDINLSSTFQTLFDKLGFLYSYQSITLLLRHTCRHNLPFMSRIPPGQALFLSLPPNNNTLYWKSL